MSDHSITSLIEKLEGAETGSRALDSLIVEALTLAPNGAFRMHGVEHGTWATGAYTTWVAPAYSTSLDAALALAERVLPGWVWNMGNDLPCWVHIWIDDRSYDGNPIKGDAVTPALALCAAVLRAHLEAR